MKPISLGSRNIYVHVNKWNDSVKVHIRNYFRNKQNELIPQKFGITLNEEELQKLLSSVNEIQAEIRTLKKEIPSNSEPQPSGSKKRPRKDKPRRVNKKKKTYQESNVCDTDNDCIFE